jgi:hypothetical protein
VIVRGPELTDIIIGVAADGDGSLANSGIIGEVDAGVMRGIERPGTRSLLRGVITTADSGIWGEESRTTSSTIGAAGTEYLSMDCCGRNDEYANFIVTIAVAYPKGIGFHLVSPRLHLSDNG